jgi:soluble lytic murein transglycosylase-like protein
MRLNSVPLPVIATALLVSSAAAGASLSRAQFGHEITTSTSSLRVADSAPGRSPFSAPHRLPSGIPQLRRPGNFTAAVQSASAAHRDVPRDEVDRWTTILAADEETAAALSRLPTYSRLFHEALSAHDVPADFAALPIIESALLPQATSEAGAAGIWQLMPATARAYGLEVSHWVDERRDPVRSTQAAVRHLHDLHTELGSWHLAAAAYNCGSAKLRRAIGRSRSDLAYWTHRNRLPGETRDYVPKLLAAVRIARRTGASKPGPQLRFTEVTVPGGVPLSAVATAYGVTDDALSRLNPHLVRGATPPGRPWPVRLPVP